MQENDQKIIQSPIQQALLESQLQNDKMHN